MKKLFNNAVFHLMNERNDTAIAILTENGKITDVYVDALPHLSDCEIVDLKGRHVYPGFIDTHTHSFEGGHYSQSINLLHATSIHQCLEMINDYYQKCSKTEIDVIDAFRFDENKIPEKRFPTIYELDNVCPDIPFVLRRIDGHSSAVNSFAWKKFLEANPHAEKLSSRHDSLLRGPLNDAVVHWFLENLSEQTILNAYQQASRIAVQNGITAVHTMIGDSQNSISHYKLIKDNLHLFDTEFILYPQSFNIKAALDVGATRIGGCILVDGSLGSYTAALRQPYSDKPETSGLLYHDNLFWEKFITESAAYDLQVAVHCIGDKAIKQINDIYLKLYMDKEHDLRHELIHCELTPDDLLAEIVASKAVPVMQPAFDLYWGGEDRFYQKVLGKTRADNMNRFNSFMQKGVKITGGSDWYITELDAMQGIKAAVNHHNPQERISPFEALQMYTSNAAWLSHDEARLGILQKGFDADFVCFNSDIMSGNNLNVEQVALTYKKGKQVYCR